MRLAWPKLRLLSVSLQPKWTPVKIVKHRRITAVLGILAAAGVALLGFGGFASAAEEGPVTWGYGYITVNATWADLTTDLRSTWVAVGSGGKLATSKDDGANWSIPALPSGVTTTTSFTSVTHGDKVWIVLDTSGNILTSPDGLAWTLAYTSTKNWTGAAYGEGRWVVFSADTGETYATSDDNGATWKTQTLPYKLAIDELAYGNGVWAAVGAGNGSVQRHILTTEDGATWDWVSNAAANWTDVEFGLGKFIALSAPGAISTSIDGRNWTEAAYPLPGAASGTTWRSVTAGNDGFMAIGSGKDSGGVAIGLAAYSADAVTWKRVPIISATWSSIQADDDGFIALGYYSNGNTVIMRGGLVAPGSSGGYAISPWMQSIGRPARDVTCPAGWAPSWAQWPNGDSGGFVCDRTIANSESHGGWMVFLGGQWWDAPDSVYVRG